MSATRPSGYPGWASGAAATNIAQPTAQQMSEGWNVGQAPPSSYQNWLQSLTYSWIKYLDELRGGHALYGDGSDGDAVLDGSATVSWATGPSAFAYLAIRTPTPRNLTIASGVELQMGGHGGPYVFDQLLATGSGRITQNGEAGGSATGTSGAAGTPGRPGPAGSVGGGGTGGWGTWNNNTSFGITAFNRTSSYGGQGGTGGGDAGGTPAGGTCVSPTSFQGTPHMPHAVIGHLIGGGVLTLFTGGAGGGGGSRGSLGGGVPTGVGGGGGGGGGVLAVAARRMYLAPTSLQAYGGAGGSGLGTNGCPGGGGGGGVLVVGYGEKSTGVTFSAELCCRGGVPGSVLGGSFTAHTGLAGQVFVFPLEL